MSLEDNLDIEPVCVKGIEPVLAMESAYDAGLITKSDLNYYKVIKCIPSMYFALGGFLLSCFTPVTFTMAALSFGLALAELKHRFSQALNYHN
ncbi:MAG: hypothetical protein L6266_04985 [Nanoarchaeota archaeon]|nr:hypothetical protein [Nanoarchaeota archaeon]